jgi:MFS family permease
MSTDVMAPARLALGRNYRWLWTSSAAANLADGIVLVAMPLMAVSLTTSPVLVAGVTIAGRLPWLVFVLVAGAIADRFDRRVTMRNVQAMRVIVLGSLALLALAGELSLPILYVAAFVLGVGETLFDTSAQSIMPAVVPRDLLSRANGRLYAVEMIMNQFVGPPLGGILVAISVPLALAGSTLAYVVAAAGLVLMVGTFRAASEGPRPSMLADIVAGLRYLLGHGVLRTMAIMVGVSNLASSAFTAVLVLYVVAPGPMGLDEVGFGVLTTGWAIGAVGGSVLAPRLERRLGRSNTLFLCVIGYGGTLIVPALTTAPVPIMGSMVVSGAFIMVWNIITVTLRQRIVPDQMLGRVNAGYRLFAWGSMPIGALLGGVIAQAFGLEAVFILGALMTLALLGFRPVLTERSLAAAELPSTALETTAAP